MMRAIRIEPCVQLESPLVSFVYCESERIVCRLRRPTHLRGKKFGPRLEWRRIHGISGRTHLQNDRVEVEIDRFVQYQGELRLLLPAVQTRLRGPVDIGNGCDPHSAKLTRYRRRLFL